MTRVIAKPVPVKRIAMKSLAIVILALVIAFGTLVWIRYRPAIDQAPQTATVVVQPAWGTVSVAVDSAATETGSPAAPSAGSGQAAP